MRYSLHPVGTRTNACTLGPDTKWKYLGDEGPGNGTPAVLSQNLARTFETSGLYWTTYREISDVEPDKNDSNPASGSMCLPVMTASENYDTDDDLTDEHSGATCQS